MAAEFFGNCQICGREQKAHPHKIAKHGYTLQHGWQSGACFGSEGSPIQTSCNLIDRAIESAKNYVQFAQAEISRLSSDKPLDANGKIYAVMDMLSLDGSTHKGFSLATVVTNEKGDFELRNNSGNVVQTYRQSSYGTIDKVIAALADTRVRYLANTIEQSEESVTEMTERKANWKPTPLRPVTEADRAVNAVKVHFAATKYGRKTGVCVASSSGASTYKQTTDDRSKVTCAACLKELARLDDLPRLKAEQAEKERLQSIKRCERDIKEYTKQAKRAGTDADVLYWSKMINEEVTQLEALKAQAPAQAAQ